MVGSAPPRSSRRIKGPRCVQPGRRWRGSCGRVAGTAVPRLLGRHGCYRHWLDAGLFDAMLQAVAAVPSRPRAQDRTTMLASDAGKSLSAYRISVV